MSDTLDLSQLSLTATLHWHALESMQTLWWRNVSDLGNCPLAAILHDSSHPSCSSVLQQNTEFLLSQLLQYWLEVSRSRSTRMKESNNFTMPVQALHVYNTTSVLTSSLNPVAITQIKCLCVIWMLLICVHMRRGIMCYFEVSSDKRCF